LNQFTNTQELAREIAGKNPINIGESRKILNDLFEEITGNLENGIEVRIQGFGKFTTISKPTRKRNHPQTGKQSA